MTKKTDDEIRREFQQEVEQAPSDKRRPLKFRTPKQVAASKANWARAQICAAKAQVTQALRYEADPETRKDLEEALVPLRRACGRLWPVVPTPDADGYF